MNVRRFPRKTDMKQAAFAVVLVLALATTLGITVVPHPPPTIRLSWTAHLPPGAVVAIRQSTNFFSPPLSWTTVATVTGTNALTLPVNSPRSFFYASVVGETMTLAWEYPAAELSLPGLSFNLYWEPIGATSWTFVANLSADALTARFFSPVSRGRIALTATNSILHAESEFSNIASWTNSVGQQIPLYIQIP